MKRIAVALCTLGLTLLLGSCGHDELVTGLDPVASQIESLAGDIALASGNIAGANTHYRAAIERDPNNPQANIGVAVTEVYLLQSDTQVDSVLSSVPLLRYGPADSEQLQSAGGGQPLPSTNLAVGLLFDPIATGTLMGKILLRCADNPVALSTVQGIVRNKVLPKLLYVEQRLNVVEQHPEWSFRIPPSARTGPDTLEVDLGEIYALDAIVNDVQGWLGIFVAYNFDIGHGAANPESLLAAGTNFGKLYPSGSADLTAAKNNFLTSNVRFAQMIAFINAETDNQSTDVIPKSALSEQPFLDFKANFDAAYASLTATVNITIKDYLGHPVEIPFQLGSFFTHPISDWKTKMPAHTFDVNHQVVITHPITFPDPAFNTIFPGMTNPQWQAIFGPLPAP